MLCGFTQGACTVPSTPENCECSKKWGKDIFHAKQTCCSLPVWPEGPLGIAHLGCRSPAGGGGGSASSVLPSVGFQTSVSPVKTHRQ